MERELKLLEKREKMRNSRQNEAAKHKLKIEKRRETHKRVAEMKKMEITKK